MGEKVFIALFLTLSIDRGHCGDGVLASVDSQYAIQRDKS